MASSSVRLVVLFRRFGPYHVARLDAAAAVFGSRGWEVRGIGVAASDLHYPWRAIDGVREENLDVLFPGRTYEEVSRGAVVDALLAVLDRLTPAAIAVPGYHEPVARAALAWAVLGGSTAVLMSESKRDDAVRWWPVEAVKRRVAGLFDAALVGGRAQARYATELGVPSERVVLGYDVVDNQTFGEGADQVREREAAWRATHSLPRPFFLASCRFLRRKNVVRLVEAFARYRSDRGADAWDLVVLGSGTEEPRIMRAIRRHGLAATVRLPGFRQIEELPAWYGLATALIHPALQEQWGLVVNEAMACGTPVAVSRTVGAAELVRPWIDGWTFDPRDVQGIAACLGSIHDVGIDGLRTMGASARSSIQSWGPSRFGEGLAAAVESGRAASLTRGSKDRDLARLVLAVTRKAG